MHLYICIYIYTLVLVSLHVHCLSLYIYVCTHTVYQLTNQTPTNKDPEINYSTHFTADDLNLHDSSISADQNYSPPNFRLTTPTNYSIFSTICILLSLYMTTYLLGFLDSPPHSFHCLSLSLYQSLIPIPFYPSPMENSHHPAKS